MKVLEGLDALAAADLRGGAEGIDGSAVCVGVFDGVHLGHQRLLQQLLEMASELQAVPTAVTFRQHPDELLRGEAPPLLVSVPHRLRLLRRAGIERCALLDFDARLREMDAARFARTVLADGLRARGLLLGYDSALGKDR
jgi:riboflavin kinase/FMN adenylyltransferase